MYCYVKNCRFNDKHTTSGHKCGKCKKYGHGQIECGKQQLINELSQYSDNKLPYNLQCTHDNCKRRWTHTSAGHHCHKCHLIHNSSNCIIQSIDKAEELYSIKLDTYETLLDNYTNTNNNTNNNNTNNNNTNCYTTMYMGMGCMLYIKKTNDNITTLYMHGDHWGQYGIETDHSGVYKRFIMDSVEVN